MSDPRNTLCRPLPWDSEFWGFPVAVVDGGRLTAAAAGECLAWCAARGIRCLYFAADGSDPATLRVAAETGFRFVDVRVDMEHRGANEALPQSQDYKTQDPRRKLDLPNADSRIQESSEAARQTEDRRLEDRRRKAEDLAYQTQVHEFKDSSAEGWETGASGIRLARGEDLPAACDLARRSHDDTRFFKDTRFPREQARELYAKWIAADFDRGVILVDAPDAPAATIRGYVTCRMETADQGRIGLLAVDAGARRGGTGRRLLAAALRWFAAQGASAVRVATQASNVPALRLYENSGFMVRETRVWFHQFFS